MNKYKVCVYAICKNESKFIERWVNSMKEADAIYVLDTGSTDNSVEILEKLGVNVKVEEIKPWRFDIARNKSLDMVPLDTDICVCTDLDEVFDSGWRNKLEEIWNDKVDKVKYNINWSFDEYGNPATTFFIEKIHRREGYKWLHPVHEVLSVLENEVSILSPHITLNHYPDSEKSRSGYLPLLELSVEEDPNDDRNMHYLGREYMYYSKWNECIETLIKHLTLKTATWKDERCASMRFIARSYSNLGRLEEAKIWLEKAINEAPYLREPYVEMALLQYKLENDIETIKNCILALRIKKNKMSYINESFCWDSTIDDLLSISYYNLGIYDIALYHIDRALLKDNNNDRLLKNKMFILEKINEE